jgi:threonine synthase
MRGFETSKAMQLSNAQRAAISGLFTASRADPSDMAQAMRWAYEKAGQVLDPHTAIGLHAARAATSGPAVGLPQDVPVVTLATAHPAKFTDAVERATGVRVALPARVGDLFEREERFTHLPGDYAGVAAWIAERATPRTANG